MELYELEITKEIARELSKEVYRDGLKPITIEGGKSLQTIGKVLNMLLAPFEIASKSLELYKDKFLISLEERVSRIPEEKLVGPALNIVGPTLDSLRFNLDNEALRELYVNLLASSMNTDTVGITHPSFIEIIRQLSPLDAKVFANISERKVYPVCQVILTRKVAGSFIIFDNFTVLEKMEVEPLLVSVSLQNLQRLGLIELDYQSSLVVKTRYDILESDETFQKLKSNNEKLEGDVVNLRKGVIRVTVFGQNFAEVCID